MALSGCFWVGSGGKKGRWRACLGVLGRQHCSTISNRKGGWWQQWACRGVLRVVTSARWQGRRVAVGVLQRSLDGVFEVVFARRWLRGREGRVGTMCFARCGRLWRCRPIGWGCLTMAWRDYSVVLLFQLAAWTTLQFWWLQVAAMIALSFLKCVLHSTLPPIGTATIAHAFKKNCEGGGAGGWGCGW